MSQKRVNLLNVLIDDIPLDVALKRTKKHIMGEGKSFIVTPNLEMLSRAQKNGDLRRALNRATLSLPDGFSLRIIARILEKRMKNTVAGIDFGKALLKLCAKEGYGVFLLGGKRGVALRAAKNLAKEMPSLKICGVHHGYFAQNDTEELIKRMDSSGAEVVFVCLGSPKQELFADFVRQKLKKAKILVCLGGSLDVWSGDVKRAPKAWRNCHLEWLWRVIKEPQRASRVIKSIDVFGTAVCMNLKEKCFSRNNSSARDI